MEKQQATSIQQFIKSNRAKFDHVLDKLRVTSAGSGCCLAELMVVEEHTDSTGFLHSGLSATLVDTLCSYAFKTGDNCQGQSVNVDLHVTYVKRAQLGEEVVIECRTVERAGKLAFVEGVISRKGSGDVLVRGRQTRFLMED